MPLRTPDNQGTYTQDQASKDIAQLRGQMGYLTEANTQLDTNAVINTPTGGNTQFSSSGQNKYASSDGSAYNTGSLRQAISHRCRL